MRSLSNPFAHRSRLALVLLTITGPAGAANSRPASSTAAALRVPPGVVVEEVATAPLVEYPLFACFDNRGRLFVAEGTGRNLPGTELLPLKLGKIRMLEDTDGDGKFDTSTIFADQLVFPQGVLWQDGALYVASHPSIWRLEDIDDDGVADKREELVGKFGFNGNGCDIHGPFMGPDGWLYWTDGRHGYRVQTREGPLLEGLAARIWRCRFDGTGIERIAGGPFDNPVELEFTETGDLIGTMDQGGPGDMLLHYVEGGVYPRDDHPTLKEFPRTGPLLEPLATYSPALPAALCGMVRLRHDYFGSDYKGTFLSTQFNLHRVEQHVLTRNGASFRAVNNDFFVSTDDHMHLTDVLEDADGSLLVVDMGAWFNYGCPTLKIAQPHITGKILRLRRTDAAVSQDPWGKSPPWGTMSPAQLIELLEEPRVKVRDRAIEALVKLGEEAVRPVAGMIGGHSGRRYSAGLRREATWILSRIGSPEARAAVREAMADSDAGVRQVALHCVSLERDAAALPALLQIVVEDEPHLRMKAAEALGRLGQREGVSALLTSLHHTGNDRVLEHALIYALIRIGDFQGTAAALKDPDPRVRRAGLVALDQMNGTEKPVPVPAGDAAAKDNPFRGATFEYIGNDMLTREHVAPLLDTDDDDLQQAALEVISRRPGWAGETIALATEWLESTSLDPAQQQALTGTLLAFCEDERIQQMVAAASGGSATPAQRKVLYDVMARCRLEKLPASWLARIEEALRQVEDGGGNDELARGAIDVIRIRKLATFDPVLQSIADQVALSPELRVAALACLGDRVDLNARRFELLKAQLDGDVEPLLQMTAATVLGSATTRREQLVELAGLVSRASPLVTRLLVPAFSRSQDAEVGHALVRELQENAGTDAFLGSELAQLLRRYPAGVATAAQPLIDSHSGTLASQEAYLQELSHQLALHPGDPQRGEKVFLSKAAGCYTCHSVDGRGGGAGPDLSQVGRFRTRAALLEAIAFPSSSIVPDFRPFVIASKGGDTVFGTIIRETAEAIHLRTPQLAEIRVPRGEIATITSPDISMMPGGLEKMITSQELSDLVEYLYQRR